MLRKAHFPIACLCILLLSVGFWGCKEKNQPPVKAGAQKQKAAAEAPAPQQEQRVEQESYTYEAKGRRDPFKSLVQVAKERPARIKKANPIENYDVDEIRLTAIVWDNNHYYALITLPDNKSYTIKRGMTLGLYGGKVEDIKKDSVLIREQVKDYRGQPKTKDTILRLRKEGEE